MSLCAWKTYNIAPLKIDIENEIKMNQKQCLPICDSAGSNTTSPLSPLSLMVFQHLMCAGLWCLVDGDPSCKTKLDPPLEGTECGTDKVRSSEINKMFLSPFLFFFQTQNLFSEDVQCSQISDFSTVVKYDCFLDSGAEGDNVSVRLPSPNMWMETGVPGASGACAVGPVVLGSSSDRGSVTTRRMFLCALLYIILQSPTDKRQTN